MSDDSQEFDAEIIRDAYAEKVKEAFKIFAENLGMGQNLKSSTERFVRTLELTRRARDLALASLSTTLAAEMAAQNEDAAAAADAAGQQQGMEGLSAEDQAMIEQALAGTTGQKPLHRR